MTIETCKCGADAEYVCLIKSKAKCQCGSNYVACVKCGRVGLHGKSQRAAIENWNNAVDGKERFYFGTWSGGDGV